jgi:type IV secretory pathway TraG/TraD family ATPase VirD4
MNQLRPLLLSDVFDKELPRIGLTDYYQDPEGVLLLDNVQKDRYARGFWRFLIQTAADYSFESAGTEYFLLDELDKLPPIGNLGELASRGRKPGSLAMLAFQDLGQLLDTYGEDTARTIWTNCPNSVTFNPGDDVGAEWAVDALGEEEVRA